MKLFKTIAATAAVITCCIGNSLPVQASMSIDLNSGLVRIKNDGDPHTYLARNGMTVRTYSGENFRYPIEEAGVGTSHSQTMSAQQHRTHTEIFEKWLRLDAEPRRLGMQNHPGVLVFQNRDGGR